MCLRKATGLTRLILPGRRVLVVILSAVGGVCEVGRHVSSDTVYPFTRYA